VKNTVVVITGASSGIGKALAYKFAKKGAKVVMGARNYAALIGIADDIIADGGVAISVEMDVTIEADCKRLIDEAIANFDKIDVLINNAGISMRAIFENTDIEVIKRLMDVNFWGTVYCTKYALPHLLDQKGSVVGVSSIAGLKGLPARTGYSASKFAMKGFLEALRVENLKKGIHVLMAYPGFTATNIRAVSLNSDGTEQGVSPRDEEKMMSAEEVAQHIYIAVKKRKDKIVLTRQGKLLLFLNAFMPKKLDKMIFRGLTKEPDSPFG